MLAATAVAIGQLKQLPSILPANSSAGSGNRDPYWSDMNTPAPSRGNLLLPTSKHRQVWCVLITDPQKQNKLQLCLLKASKAVLKLSNKLVFIFSFFTKKESAK